MLNSPFSGTRANACEKQTDLKESRVFSDTPTHIKFSSNRLGKFKRKEFRCFVGV